MEDTVAFSFSTFDGALGSFFLSDVTVSPYSWEHTSGENKSYPNVAENCYVVHGEKGSLAIQQMRIYSQSIEQNWWLDFEITDHKPRNDDCAYENQVSHFISVIEESEPPLVTVNDSYRFFKTSRKLGHEE